MLIHWHVRTISSVPLTSVDFGLFASDTVYMTLTLELASVALLVIIVIELLLIHRDLLYITSRSRRSDAENSGQTINVNVGPHDGSSKREHGLNFESTSPAPLVLTEHEEPQEIEKEAAEEVPLKSSYIPREKATPSGLVAKRCPACGMENSSMRSECFNCGGTL